MRCNSNYVIVRLHDGRYRLDRIAPPTPGQVAYAKPVTDRQGSTIGWKLHPIVMVQGSRSKVWPTAAEALASTKLLTAAEARRLLASDGPKAPGGKAGP